MTVKEVILKAKELEDNGDYEKAKKYYQAVIDKLPNTKYAQFSQKRINRINENQEIEIDDIITPPCDSSTSSNNSQKKKMQNDNNHIQKKPSFKRISFWIIIGIIVFAFASCNILIGMQDKKEKAQKQKQQQLINPILTIKDVYLINYGYDNNSDYNNKITMYIFMTLDPLKKGNMNLYIPDPGSCITLTINKNDYNPIMTYFDTDTVWDTALAKATGYNNITGIDEDEILYAGKSKQKKILARFEIRYGDYAETLNTNKIKLKWEGFSNNQNDDDDGITIKKSINSKNIVVTNSWKDLIDNLNAKGMITDPSATQIFNNN